MTPHGHGENAEARRPEVYPVGALRGCPNEGNLKPAHPDFSKIRFSAAKPFVFDKAPKVGYEGCTSVTSIIPGSTHIVVDVPPVEEPHNSEMPDRQLGGCA